MTDTTTEKEPDQFHQLGRGRRPKRAMTPYVTGALIGLAAVPLAYWLVRGRGAAKIGALALTAGEGLWAYGVDHAPTKRELKRGMHKAKRGIAEFAHDHAPSRRELRHTVQELAAELLAFAASRAPSRRELERGARDARNHLLEHAPSKRELRRMADDARETLRDRAPSRRELRRMADDVHDIARERFEDARRYGRDTADEAWRTGEKRVRREAKRRGWW